MADSSAPSPLSMAERRALFSKGNSIPTPSGDLSLASKVGICITVPRTDKKQPSTSTISPSASVTITMPTTKNSPALKKVKTVTFVDDNHTSMVNIDPNNPSATVYPCTRGRNCSFFRNNKTSSCFGMHCTDEELYEHLQQMKDTCNKYNSEDITRMENSLIDGTLTGVDWEKAEAKLAKIRKNMHFAYHKLNEFCALWNL